jgi:hypothetical protein
MLADRSTDISRADAKAIKSQKAVTSHQKLENRQLCDLGLCKAGSRLVCAISFILSLRDWLEPTEVSLMSTMLRERHFKVTRAPGFSSHNLVSSSPLIPVLSHKSQKDCKVKLVERASV